MNGERFLRDKARELIQAGGVPGRPPDRVWGGSAFGGYCCMLCATPIAPNEIALEVEFSPSAESERAHGHFHSPCFLALELELLNLKVGGQSISRSDPVHSAATSRPVDGIGSLEASQP
jgi:hypothetical protein